MARAPRPCGARTSDVTGYHCGPVNSSSEANPTVIIIGGPNGTGKTTIAPALLAHLGMETFVNADTIARGLSALNPEGRAFEASRIMLGELHRLAERRESFAFETTLASRTFQPWLRRLIKTGYQFALGYVWVRSAEIAVARVANRVKAGGHDVPEDVVRRRWDRSARNLWNLYLPLAHTWRVYDNSGTERAGLIARGVLNESEQIFNAHTWSFLRNFR